MDEFTSKSAEGQPGRSAGVAEWLALGAVVAGTVGAIVGAGRCAARGAHRSHVHPERPDSALLTAPHGDKLFP